MENIPGITTLGLLEKIQSGKFVEFFCLFGRLSLNSLSVRAITVREESKLHVDLPARCHRHDYDLTWFGRRDTVVYGAAGGNRTAKGIEL